jgi:hypothetical protein
MVLCALASKDETWRGEAPKTSKKAKSLGGVLPITLGHNKKPQSLCFSGGFGLGLSGECLGRQLGGGETRWKKNGIMREGTWAKG